MPRNETVTLVGAGLVGSLLSLYLARRGYAVEIYERRPDMRREDISAGRSINLAVSARGFHALGEVGLEDAVRREAIPMLGRLIHPLTNPGVAGELAFQRYGKDDSEAIFSVSRSALNRLLMTEAEKTGKVRIHFHKKVSRVDLSRREIGLEGSDRPVSFERLIGTDGSASVVRQAICAGDNRESVLDYGYKELVIPPAAAPGTFALSSNALHIWPRGNFMLIALPNRDASFTCTLFLSGAELDRLGEAGETAAVDFFRRNFPDALSRMPAFASDFRDHPVGTMTTVYCSPWHFTGRALLVGDAAHAIVPFFGQGMNCGFEDCSILNELLGREGAAGEWERVFQDFARIRKPDADAIAEMAIENFVEMRDRVGDPRFLFQKEVEKTLLREFPHDFVSRYSLVTFTRVPYRVALRAGRISDEILAELCRGLTDPGAVDLVRARSLIQEKMVPFLKVP